MLLIGGTSEIGLAILSALELGPDAAVILAGRDLQRMEIAAKTLPGDVSVVTYDATDGRPPAVRGRGLRDRGA